PHARQQVGVVKQADTSAGLVTEKPVEREPMPRRGRVGCVVERENRDRHQRQEQEYQEGADVQRRAEAQPGRTRQGGNHVRRITSLKRWPLALSPNHTMAVDRASSRKPKAAPCSQLKRVMNWL